MGSTDSATKACQAYASDAAWRSSPIAPQRCAAGAGLNGHDVGRSALRQARRLRNKTFRDVSEHPSGMCPVCTTEPYRMHRSRERFAAAMAHTVMARLVPIGANLVDWRP